MNYKVGQSVVVKSGVMAPDAPKLSLSGWQGRVIEIVQDENGGDLVIAWDSITLRNIPEYYLEQSELDGSDWSEYYLNFEDVELTEARDSENDVEDAIDEIADQVEWLDLGDEGKRIRAVLNSPENEDDWDEHKIWSNYLQQKLKFPFEAEVDEYQERGPLKEWDKLKIVRIEMEDDLYGIIVHCFKGKSEYDFPLCDLAVLNKRSSNFQLVQDYRVWFANQ